jgi:hypothetical protein
MYDVDKIMTETAKVFGEEPVILSLCKRELAWEWIRSSAVRGRLDTRNLQITQRLYVSEEFYFWGGSQYNFLSILSLSVQFKRAQ